MAGEADVPFFSIIGSDFDGTGAVPHDDVPYYAAAADLFVFSSVTETQGLVLIGAMAAGTPVVAVKAPGSVDVLEGGRGLLVPAQEDACAEAVLELLADEPRRQAMGEKAAQVVQRYTIPDATKRLLAVYGAAVAAGPRDRGQGHEKGFQFSLSILNYAQAEGRCPNCSTPLAGVETGNRNPHIT